MTILVNLKIAGAKHLPSCENTINNVKREKGRSLSRENTINILKEAEDASCPVKTYTKYDLYDGSVYWVKGTHPFPYSGRNWGWVRGVGGPPITDRPTPNHNILYCLYSVCRAAFTASKAVS